MLSSALCYSTTGFVVTPIKSMPTSLHHRATVVMDADAEAKARWLAKLDPPAWAAAAKAMTAVATEAEKIQAKAEPLTKEEEAKKAWLSKLDVPSWGDAAEAIATIATIEQVTEPLEDVTSLPTKMSEEDAKKAWLSKIETPAWGKISEEEAKAQWLAKLDTPVWGQAAAAMISVVAEANKMADLTEGCDAGDAAACDALSQEDEAKKAWLAKLDVPSWGTMTEDAAKKAWLAKLDAKPSWQGHVAMTRTSAAGEPILFR